MKNPASRRPNEMNMTRQRALWRVLTAALAALLLLFGSSGAALAHDAVTGTSPENGASVESVPAAIEITMSNAPAVIGSQVLVLDEAGHNWAEGGVEVLDNVASQAVRPGAPAGEYTVKWRLVSSDSHPIEGEFSFTSMTSATAGAVVGSGPIASVQAQPEQAPQTVQDESAVPWSVIGLIAVLLGLIVALVVVARRRLSNED